MSISKWPVLAIVVSSLALLPSEKVFPEAVSASPDVLTTEVSLNVYAQETLESVLFRLHTITRCPMLWDARMLADCRAKPATYRLVPLKTILAEQLEGTPIRYELKKKKLVFYRAKTASVVN
ncbi:hypothetical protein ACFOET_05755 [Parapedobacter deserti]|uniref:Secretin/TonB short N-terminal domain-containing protein n=1 Tax=Parapedobacter deserti TaxID=1912957 RepID=A0ABV7JJ37_9SPHI